MVAFWPIFFTMNNPNYYAVIPANVRYCKTVPDGAKLLFGEITALTNKEGYCWASNAYFSNLYGKSPDTISRWVSSLVKSGFIEVEIQKENGNERRIRLSANLTTPIGKNADTSRQKYGYPIRKNAEHNNKKNITSNRSRDNEKSSLSPGGENPPLTNKKGEERQDAPRCASDTPPPASLLDTPEQRLTIAQAMIAHAKGEGAEQWQFMCTAQGYTGTPEAVLSIWASKATPYQLANWKKEFNKLHYWLRNEARARKESPAVLDDVKFV